MGDANVNTRENIISVSPTCNWVECALANICGSSIAPNMPVPILQIKLSTNDKRICGDYGLETNINILPRH